MIPAFNFARPPRVVFGAGRVSEVGSIARSFGNRVLLVTGGSSLAASGYLTKIRGWLNAERLEVESLTVSTEPSPDLVDRAVTQYRDRLDVIISVGGGSVLDAGKAISAMLPLGDSVLDYLEGVGKGKLHPGIKIPVIAVPTTAGTGSEATKNAVLSHVGAMGFKRSLRHDNFVPEVAILDPELTLSCPAALTAACGMDAITQLIEAYVSVKASPLTDSLALGAFQSALDALPAACGAGAHDVNIRGHLSVASFVSGVALANAGLGVVHGIASALGGCFSLPHGVICGTLLASATEKVIGRLKEEGNVRGLLKYSELGAQLTTDSHIDKRTAALIDKLWERTRALGLPKLGSFGVKATDLDAVVEGSSNKESPAKLSQKDIRSVIVSRL